MKLHEWVASWRLELEISLKIYVVAYRTQLEYPCGEFSRTGSLDQEATYLITTGGLAP